MTDKEEIDNFFEKYDVKVISEGSILFFLAIKQPGDKFIITVKSAISTGHKHHDNKEAEKA